MLFKRIRPVINQHCIIPEHQFGFRRNHSTVEQVNRVYSTARIAIEDGEFCTAVFIDVSQALDKVWHPALLFKVKKHSTRYMARLQDHLTALGGNLACSYEDRRLQRC